MMRLRVDGMTCQHCEMAVSRALAGVAGVERVVQVDRARGEAVIEGAPDPAALVAAVGAEGYEAALVP